MRVWGTICGLGMLLSLGCHGSSPQLNPFVPAASPQLPPPPTGTAGRTDPYYQRPMASTPNGSAAQMSALPSVPTARFQSTDPVNNAAPAQPPAGSGAQLDWRAPAPGSQVVPASGTSPGWQSPPRY